MKKYIAEAKEKATSVEKYAVENGAVCGRYGLYPVWVMLREDCQAFAFGKRRKHPTLILPF